jgi:transcription elongation factor GreB
MGRYRPPRPKSSNYITPEGAETLRRELDYLWKTKRPEVTRAVADAAAQGDRSENAEYIYGKKQLAEIDRRVRYLRKRFDDMRIVDQLPGDRGKVYFGAWFELAADDDATHRYRLVGPDEHDFESCYVSMDSPLGRAVMGKAVGDEFELSAPQGERRYRILAVSYENGADKKRPGL